MSKRKPAARKILSGKIWTDDQKWSVHHGELKPGRGRPAGAERLFQVVAEKLPYASLDEVRKHMKSNDLSHNGVYIAHDSMGYARYVGRGNIFNRLKSHKKAHDLELAYFSFYVVHDKKHEREIETILIRAAGPLLEFNDRKKRVTIKAGNLHDYEAHTQFYERQYKKGKAKKRAVREG